MPGHERALCRTGIVVLATEEANRTDHGNRHIRQSACHSPDRLPGSSLSTIWQAGLPRGGRPRQNVRFPTEAGATDACWQASSSGTRVGLATGTDRPPVGAASCRLSRCRAGSVSVEPVGRRFAGALAPAGCPRSRRQDSHGGSSGHGDHPTGRTPDRVSHPSGSPCSGAELEPSRSRPSTAP